MVLVALFVFVVSPGPTEASPLQQARILESALTDLQSVALDGADDSAISGNALSESKRDNVAVQAIGLRLDLHRQVQRAIKLGQSNTYVRNRLKNLEADLADLNTLAHQSGISAAIKLAYGDVEAAWLELEEELQGVSQVLSATCVGKFGGNFFNKKTHVECTVNGTGAVSYYVEFKNEGQTASAQGPLTESLSQQTFSSDKVSIGNYANFDVYLLDTSGDYHLVASGQAEGNPF